MINKKTLASGMYCKRVMGKSGDELMIAKVNVPKFIHFLEAHADERGFIKLLFEPKISDEWGNNVSVSKRHKQTEGLLNYGDE